MKLESKFFNSRSDSLDSLQKSDKSIDFKHKRASNNDYFKKLLEKHHLGIVSRRIRGHLLENSDLD